MKNPTRNYQRQLDRRNFLRRSGFAVGGIVGLTAASPFVSFAQMEQPGALPTQQDSGKQTVLGPSLSRQFARWVAGLRYEDLSPAAADRAKGFTLHALTSMLLGSQTAEGRFVTKLITDEEAGVRNGATIMVDGTKVTMSGAAFANAEMTNAGETLDSYLMLTHPGMSIVPGAFAAAEVAGASGKDFVTGLAAGYEVMARMAADYVPTLAARGFDPGSVFGIFGAAIAAAKIMHLNEDQVNATIGLCATMAAGNRSLSARGAAARNAMLAVALAKQGRSGGGEASLEGDAGFYHGYAGNNQGRLIYSFVGDIKTNLYKITADLGKKWAFLETVYRIYPISGYNIPHIDVTAKLCEEHNIRYQDVDRVEAVVNWLETQYPSPAFPTRREDATTEPKRGSTRYYTAYGVVKRGFPVLGLRGAPDPPEVLDLMKRVTIIPSYTEPLFAPRITIFTKDGKSYTKQGTGHEFTYDFAEEARRIREVIPGLPIPPAQYEEMIATCGSLDQQNLAAKLIQLTLKKT